MVTMRTTSKSVVMCHPRLETKFDRSEEEAHSLLAISFHFFHRVEDNFIFVKIDKKSIGKCGFTNSNSYESFVDVFFTCLLKWFQHFPFFPQLLLIIRDFLICLYKYLDIIIYSAVAFAVVLFVVNELGHCLRSMPFL